MDRTAMKSLAHALVPIAVAALLGGCADQALLGPDRGPASANAALRTANLGACDNLAVPAGSKLVFRAYAAGVQIYHWDGAMWVFDAPLAVLSADRAGKSTVGTHYAGPTWESASGSKVVATVLERCTPDPGAIAWLLLGAVSSEGPGLFHRVTFIQRIATAGGNAPALPGSVIGEEARVPYTTEYLFYRTK